MAKARKPSPNQAKPPEAGEPKKSDDCWVPTVCWGCTRGPDLIRVHRVDGVAINVDADPGAAQLPLRTSVLCPKPYGFIQKLYNPHRIKGPLKRTNPQRGPGIDPRWVEIGWDEALDIVAEKLKAIRAKNSRRLSTTYSCPAERGLKGTWEPFFKVFGPTQALRGGSSIRCGLGMHSFGQYIHGAFRCYADLEYCNYLLLLGCNPFASWGVQQSSLLLDARSRGMKMVVVDPVLSSTAAIADEWLPIKPDTDGAFLLALIQVIVNELGIYDVEFLKSIFTMWNS